MLWKYKGYIEDRGTSSSLQALRKEFKNTIVFLDESSLVSTKMMWKLLKLQDKLEFKLVMTGDVKQLGSVEAGKPYEQILKIIPSVKINTIVRQKDALHKEAVIAASEGDIAKTFEIHKNNIAETHDEKALAKYSVDLYMQMDPKQQEKTLLISPTRKLRDEINNKIRTELGKAGVLTGAPATFIALKPKDMTVVAMRFALNFKPDYVIKFNASYVNGIKKGEYYKVLKANTITNSLTLEKDNKQYIFRLRTGVNYESKFEVFEEKHLQLQENLKLKFTKNDKELGLINSETAVITKMEKGVITLRIEDGQTKVIAKSQLRHIDYGYCMTVHSAQGKTYDNTIAVINNNKTLNSAKSWLVILSRHRDKFLAVVQDQDKLKSHLISNKGIEISAIEHHNKSYMKINIER